MLGTMTISSTSCLRQLNRKTTVEPKVDISSQYSKHG